MHPASTREAVLEEGMRDRGKHRFETATQKAEERGGKGDTAGGMEVARNLLAPLAAGVRQFLGSEGAAGGRPTIAGRLLSGIEPELIAYLTIKEVISAAPGGMSALRMARALASVLEDEVRMAAFDEHAPALYNTVARSLRQKSWDPDHTEKVYSAAARAAGLDLPRWAPSDKIHVGLKLIDLLIEHTGLVHDVNIPVKRNKSMKYIRLSEVGHRWIEDYNAKAAFLRPALTPTIVEPIPWVGTTGGGYLTHAVRPFSIVKRTFRPHVEALKAGDMSRVYRAVNALQSTAWRVNGPVREVMDRALDAGIQLPCLPLPEPEDLPPKPLDIDDNATAQRAWKEAAKAIYERNAEAEGKRAEIGRLMVIAQEYRDDPQIFFPHQLDFRGRGYSIPAVLQPQGSDHSKALLHFAQGKPLGDSGLRWLAIHGANVFGFDKASLDKREAWAWQHTQLASLCASDPFQWRWWTEADKPWCFLAWCFEWAALQGMASDQGRGFVSHLPVALDGSCNGLQHFSAMLRDPVGGAAVNLVPADKPQDIYQRVADRTVERLREMAGSGDERAWVARGWVDFGIDRKITKRPVMVLPYGGTMSSCMEYTRSAVRERLAAGAENPFGIELVKAEGLLASTIWASIGDVVVAARQVMSWLQQVARAVSKEGKPLQWTTPSGFVAHQEYRNVEHRRVKSRLRGSLVYLTQFTNGDKLDVSRQALGISPNFIHSLDASAMVLTICDCLDQGITSFAMIHDSYGTHAADTDTLAVSLRDAFVRMYTEHDVLDEFLRDATAGLPPEIIARLPPPPRKGDLDLSLIRQSDYFFA